MNSFPWQPILWGVGIVAMGTVSYFSSQVSIAEELGDRPTRFEVQQQITEIKEIIVREVKEIKESQSKDAQEYQSQQREVRQDIRDLREVIVQILRP